MVSLRHLYYDLKPFLPHGLRMAFRRRLASGIRRNSSSIWPIKPDTHKKPDGWPGWPKGRKFAFILTHDVEGSVGVSRCSDLAKLEEQLGFRSSFNFVPEGSYETPVELRQRLIQSGFEVGVHDLHHNGKLYRSEADFTAAAEKINHYLQDWGAVGFRSGFMHHNLVWIHALNIEYDLSTFDTDPFEPQPDGVDTIYPFWVPAGASREQGRDWKEGSRNGSGETGKVPNALPSNLPTSKEGGYVELPYTLPQDSTLFLILREQTIDIWKSKLDWIAEQGGMALLNVHPDYMNFGNGESTPSNYPARFYREFLRYVRDRYDGQYWCALPREVARFFRDSAITKPS